MFMKQALGKPVRSVPKGHGIGMRNANTETGAGRGLKDLRESGAGRGVTVVITRLVLAPGNKC